MGKIQTMIEVNEDSAGVIAGMLKLFARGQRVHVALTAAAPVHGTANGGARDGVPTLGELKARIEAARQSLPPALWETPEEALRDLRGEG